MSKKDDEDKKLWEIVKRTADPLENRNRVHPGITPPDQQKSVKSRRVDKADKTIQTTAAIARQEQQSAPTPAPDLRGQDGIDKNNWQRFIKGKMLIEASLDLHGMTQDEAHRQLTRFIQQQYQRGKRFLIIITGKGQKTSHEDAWGHPVQGVLKKGFQRWVEEPTLKSKILKIAPAQQHHGGGGAFYVLLKRQKD